MRFLTLVAVVILFFLLLLRYTGSTVQTIGEHADTTANTDLRINNAAKAVKELNRSAQERMKEADRAISDAQ